MSPISHWGWNPIMGCSRTQGSLERDMCRWSLALVQEHGSMARVREQLWVLVLPEPPILLVLLPPRVAMITARSALPWPAPVIATPKPQLLSQPPDECMCPCQCP